MTKPIYVVFDCDAFRTRSSMRLLMTTTSQEELKKFVSQRIASGDAEYGAYATPSAMQAHFESDFNTAHPDDRLRIIANVEFLYVEETEDGEPI